MLLRMVDLFKSKGITALFTNLTASDRNDHTDYGLSSLMDSWIGLHDLEANGERNRGLYLLKSRGMSHSNQIREYSITGNGVRLMDPYLGPDGVLTGSGRGGREAEERAAALARQQDVERRRREFTAKRATTERQIAELRAGLDAEEAEVNMLFDEAGAREDAWLQERTAMASRRTAAE